MTSFEQNAVSAFISKFGLPHEGADGAHGESNGASPEIDLFPFHDDQDLFNYDLAKMEGMEQLPDGTVDSGAGTSVGNPAHFPFAQVVPSAGSKAGQQFVGAGAGAKSIPNLGEMKFAMVVETGDTGSLTVQAADVRKQLLAVSSLNRKGNPVWFDNQQSFVIPATARNLAAIRKMIKEIPNKIRSIQKTACIK